VVRVLGVLRLTGDDTGLFYGAGSLLLAKIRP
jgi:hypothetical protein